MAVTVQGSGTQAASIGTEHTLVDVAVAGTYTLGVDCTNMAAGDATELRCKKIFKTSGSLIVVYYQIYLDAQVADDCGKISVPIANALTDSASLRFTLKQTLGTGRNFDWEVLRYA